MMHQSEFDVASVALSRAVDKRKSLINIRITQYTATLRGFTDILKMLREVSLIQMDILKPLLNIYLALPCVMMLLSLVCINKHSIWQQPDKLDLFQGN